MRCIYTFRGDAGQLLAATPCPLFLRFGVLTTRMCIRLNSAPLEWNGAHIQAWAKEIPVAQVEQAEVAPYLDWWGNSLLLRVHKKGGDCTYSCSDIFEHARSRPGNLGSQMLPSRGGGCLPFSQSLPTSSWSDVSVHPVRGHAITTNSLSWPSEQFWRSRVSYLRPDGTVVVATQAESSAPILLRQWKNPQKDFLPNTTIVLKGSLVSVHPLQNLVAVQGDRGIEIVSFSPGKKEEVVARLEAGTWSWTRFGWLSWEGIAGRLVWFEDSFGDLWEIRKDGIYTSSSSNYRARVLSSLEP